MSQVQLLLLVFSCIAASTTLPIPTNTSSPVDSNVLLQPYQSIVLTKQVCFLSTDTRYDWQVKVGTNGGKPRDIQDRLLHDSSISFTDAMATGYIATDYISTIGGAQCMEVLMRVVNIPSLGFTSMQVNLILRMDPTRNVAANRTFHVTLLSEVEPTTDAETTANSDSEESTTAESAATNVETTEDTPTGPSGSVTGANVHSTPVLIGAVVGGAVGGGVLVIVLAILIVTLVVRRNGKTRKSTDHEDPPATIPPPIPPPATSLPALNRQHSDMEGDP